MHQALSLLEKDDSVSRLEELIEKLCPDGVEYKELGTVATISRGGSFQKKDFVENGFPCIHYGQIYTRYNLFVNDVVSHISAQNAEKQKKAVHGDIIMAITSENIEDVCKCVAWLGNGELAVSGHTAIIHHKLEPKYLTYYLNSNLFFRQKLKFVQGTKVIEASPDKLKKVKIPAPPLEVQREIVRILDQFTELTAELTARKKQYEYYRDELITKCNAPKVELRQIIKKSCSGATPAKGHSEYYENGTIPWLRTQDVRFNEIHDIHSFITEKAVKETAAKWIPENCVIVAISGASAGRCAINKIKTTTNQHCLNMEIDDAKALYKYVYYCVASQYQELLSRKQGARGDLNSSLILGLQIPLPSLEEQHRIVSILDRFDALCNDLTSGLPAEIEARRKQYEYYRDKLLTFQEKH